MRSIQIPAFEEAHLLSWKRTEDMVVDPLQKLYFHMLYTGRYVCRETFHIHRQNFASILLLITLEGEGRLHYREKSYRLIPGSAMLINTENLHEYTALNNGWTFQYLHFHGGMSDAYLDYINAQLGPVFSLHKMVFLETEERLNAVFRETDCAGVPDYPTISAHIYSILTSFLSTKNAVGSAQKSAAAIQRAMTYIVENYHRNITTQEIADAAYLSRSYMSELFCKTYGTSPHKYLTMYRLLRAKEYLQNTAASIQEIAERTGFLDSFTFSRAFKQQFGISPSGYRKSIMQ